MVLGSQQARPGANRSYLSSRRRGGLRRIFAVIVVIALVALLVWWMLRGKAEPPTADTPPAPPAPHGQTDTTPPAAGSPFDDHPRTTRAAEPPSPPDSGRDHDTDQTDPTTTGEADADAAPPANRGTAPQIAERIRKGRTLVQQNDLVAGRAMLNAALVGPISHADALSVKQDLAAINEKLIFSPLVKQDDPYVDVHVIQPGEYLSTIAPQYEIPWRLILRVNNISDPRRVPAHARLKMIKGPFHCVVDKSDYRLDVYLSSEDEGDMYVRSFPVGLGEYGSTPVGAFVVRKHSKLTDPEWVNPRTGKRYLGSDPENPIGERWIGLRGTDSETELMRGYGLHGTIEPQSIGTDASMGCIRLLPADIELLFDMLSETKSKVIIKP